MAVDLEALDGALNSTTLTLLGDTITYTPFGGAPLTFKAIADHQEKKQTVGSTTFIESEAAVEVPVSLVAVPTGRDIVVLPQLPAVQFQPKQFTLDESGRNWLILLKKKPA